MNIFYTDPCPVNCAKYLDNKRVVKMVLETAQLLSTARTFHELETTYRPTHMNHPCAIWVRSSLENYLWTYAHFKALLEEYTRRYTRKHACERLLEELSACPPLPKVGLTPHVNCTPHKEMPTIEAYKLTLKEKWENDVYPPQWS
jgi:hypothetical protein